MAQSLDARLGDVVRRHREARGWSQERLGARAKVHRTHVGKLERGELSPSVAVLTRIARALSQRASELLGEAEGPA